MKIEITKIETNYQGTLFGIKGLDTNLFYTKEELEEIKKNIEKALKNA
jgi:hypothetical protein